MKRKKKGVEEGSIVQYERKKAREAVKYEKGDKRENKEENGGEKEERGG